MNLRRTFSVLTLACSLGVLRSYAADAPAGFTDGGITWPLRRDTVTGGYVLSNHGVLQSSAGRIFVGYQDLHRDPVRTPQRGGVDSVELVGFDLPWLGAVEN